MAERPSADQWMRVRQRLRTELGEDVFNSWFARVEFEEADKSTVFLSVPTRFLKSWIQSHYGERLLVLWQGEREGVVRVEVLVRGTIRAKAPVPRAERPADAPASAAPPSLLPAAAGASRRLPEPDGTAHRLAGRSALYLRDLLRRRRQPPRLCRGARRRRDPVRQAHPVQSALHPRRRRPRQDPSPPCHHARRAPGRSGPQGCLPDRRAFHVPLRRRAPQPDRDPLQGEPARDRPAAHRRHAVPPGQVGAAGVLPHAQRADRRRPAGGGRRRPSAGGARNARRARPFAAQGRRRLRDRRARRRAAPENPRGPLQRRARAQSRPRHPRADARIRRPVGGLQRPRSRGRAQSPRRPVAVHQPCR